MSEIMPSYYKLSKTENYQFIGLALTNVLQALMSQRFKGDIVEFSVPNQRRFILNHPDHVLQSMGSLCPFIKEEKPPGLLSLGMLGTNGDLWKKQRKSTASFFSRSKIGVLTDNMSQRTQYYMEQWHSRIEQHAIFDISDEMSKITLDVLFTSLFNMQIDEDIDELVELWLLLNDAFGMNPLELPSKCVLSFNPSRISLLVKMVRASLKLKRVEKKIYSRLRRLIYKRERKNITQPDLFDVILTQGEFTNKKQAEKVIFDQLFTFLVAGHETTSLGLTWTLYLLAQNPRYFQQIQNEVDAVLGDRQQVKDSDLTKLPVTLSVILESMRLYSPAWATARYVSQDVQMGQVMVPQGSLVTIAPYVLHRDPRFWSKPDEFCPGQVTQAMLMDKKCGYYLPFGKGPRICIGIYFAINEMLVVLAQLAKRYNIALASQQPITPIPKITLTPLGGMPMKLTYR